MQDVVQTVTVLARCIPGLCWPGLICHPASLPGSSLSVTVLACLGSYWCFSCVLTRVGSLCEAGSLSGGIQLHCHVGLLDTVVLTVYCASVVCKLGNGHKTACYLYLYKHIIVLLYYPSTITFVTFIRVFYPLLPFSPFLPLPLPYSMF